LPSPIGETIYIIRLKNGRANCKLFKHLCGIFAHMLYKIQRLREKTHRVVEKFHYVTENFETKLNIFEQNALKNQEKNRTFLV